MECKKLSQLELEILKFGVFHPEHRGTERVYLFLLLLCTLSFLNSKAFWRHTYKPTWLFPHHQHPSCPLVTILGEWEMGLGPDGNGHRLPNFWVPRVWFVLQTLIQNSSHCQDGEFVRNRTEFELSLYSLYFRKQNKFWVGQGALMVNSASSWVCWTKHGLGKPKNCHSPGW